MGRRGTQIRTNLRWMLAEQFGDHLASSATALGTLNTLIDKYRLEPSSAGQPFINKYLYFPTGALSGNEVMVVSYVAGSVIGFQPTLLSAVLSGTPYEVHARPVRRFNTALQRAEQRARQMFWVPVVDETLTFIGDTYRYSLGALSLNYIHEVRHQYSTNLWYKLRNPLKGPHEQWRIEPGDTPLLVFNKGTTDLGASGGVIQIHGTRRPLLMTADSDTCEVNEDWILEAALLYLHDSEAYANDTSAHLARHDRALQRAADSRGDFQVIRPNSVYVQG